VRADPDPVWGVFPMRTVPGLQQSWVMTSSPASSGSTVRVGTRVGARRDLAPLDGIDDDMARALIRARVRRQHRRAHRVLTRF
jgi:hypothetical protein